MLLMQAAYRVKMMISCSIHHHLFWSDEVHVANLLAWNEQSWVSQVVAAAATAVVANVAVVTAVVLTAAPALGSSSNSHSQTTLRTTRAAAAPAFVLS